MAAVEKHRRGEVALRVLHSLPSQHEKVFYREIRKLCTDFVTSLGMPRADRASAAGELLSEVMAKLLGAGSSINIDDDMQQASRITQNSTSDDQWPSGSSLETNIDTPEQDGRVLWLIKEVGGRRALEHRFEDMRRQRWGRWHGLGYRTAQFSAPANAGPGMDRDEEMLTHQDGHARELQEDHDDPHHDRDVRLAWSGMLAIASRRFKPHEDVQKLLQVLAHVPEVQAGFGVEWPVRQIVEALNIVHPDPPWNDDRVENAKKRLRNWIVGIKRDHGLDQIDLMAMFARYGRANAAMAGSDRIETSSAKRHAP
ncbi:MAG: hypothetical protein H0W86_13980 [Armatimonadetes bacterium]|nr:hypothetical protein [Armatimonadota bacterium]